MKESEAKGFIQGKLDCMKKCDVFEREYSYNTDLCDNCEYCYSQGNFGNQQEAFQMAINALEKQMKLNEMGDCYIIPKDGVFEVNGVDVNLAIQKQIAKKPRFYAHNYYCSVCNSLVGNNEFEWKRFKYCDTCGQAIDWSDEE